MSGIVCTCGKTPHEWDCPADGFESVAVPSEATEAGEGEHVIVKRGRVYDTCRCGWYGSMGDDHVAEHAPAEPDAGEVEALHIVTLHDKITGLVWSCTCRSIGAGERSRVLAAAEDHARTHAAARDARVRREAERSLLRELARGLYPRAVVSLGEGAPWVRLGRWQAARLAAALFDEEGGDDDE